jgi:hypothetical protein
MESSFIPVDAGIVRQGFPDSRSRGMTQKAGMMPL